MRSVFWIILAQTMKFSKMQEFLNREVSGISRKTHLHHQQRMFVHTLLVDSVST
jgi:hypothetical protein